MPRLDLFFYVSLLACGAGAPSEPGAATPATPAPSASASDPAAGAAPSAGPETCEGLVGMCGGWEGCAHVRPDATTLGHFVGVGDDVGRLFATDETCWEGTCNDMCWPDGSCRRGVQAIEAVMACSGAFAPEHARYHCVLEAGHCVRAGEVFRDQEVTVVTPPDCELLVDGVSSGLERSDAGEQAIWRGTVPEGTRRFGCRGTSLERAMEVRFGVHLHARLAE